MSSQIPVAFIKQYSANVFHLSQQKGSRTRPAVRTEMQKSESAFYDRIGATTAILKTGRHMDTPQIDTPHSRRMVTLSDYVWSDLVDSVDKLRMINDPASEYAVAAMNAMGRAMDDVVIAAALGNAYGGNNGATTVTLPSTQFLGAISGGSHSGLNVATLRKLKKKFDQKEVDPSIRRYLLVSAEQVEDLLEETEVTSADFNTIKALVDGNVDTFMGFKFIRTERLSNSGSFDVDTSTGVVTLGSGVANSSRQCIAFASDGLLLSIGIDVKARISERADKNYSEQVYCEMSVGATRMEEEKVVGVLCAE